MPQSKISVDGLADKDDAAKLSSAVKEVAGVMFVNVNVEQGFVVVTHKAEFDETAFKAAVTAAGFAA